MPLYINDFWSPGQQVPAILIWWLLEIGRAHWETCNYDWWRYIVRFLNLLSTRSHAKSSLYIAFAPTELNIRKSMMARMIFSLYRRRGICSPMAKAFEYFICNRFIFNRPKFFATHSSLHCLVSRRAHSAWVSLVRWITYNESWYRWRNDTTSSGGLLDLLIMYKLWSILKWVLKVSRKISFIK